MSDLMLIDSKESIARLLNQEWIVSGVLQQTAFQLRPGETYLSVNRYSCCCISCNNHRNVPPNRPPLA